MLGPFATASRRTPHYHSPGVASVASHAARTPMSTTTTTTTTTRDRGDRYGPIEWAQQIIVTKVGVAEIEMVPNRPSNRARQLYKNYLCYFCFR